MIDGVINKLISKKLSGQRALIASSVALDFLVVIDSFGRESRDNALESIGCFTCSNVIQDTSKKYQIFTLNFSYEMNWWSNFFGTIHPFKSRRKITEFKCQLEISDYLSYKQYITTFVKPAFYQKCLNKIFAFYGSDYKLKLFSTEKNLFNTFEYDFISKCTISVKNISCMYKLPLPDT